jgi:hypothetical protein
LPVLKWDDGTFIAKPANTGFSSLAGRFPSHQYLIGRKNMKCYTVNEIIDWVGTRGVPYSPYGGKRTPNHYVQFVPPQTHRKTEAFIRHYLWNGLSAKPILIHLTDWGLYEPSEMIVIEAIRGRYGETRSLVDAPGHAFPPEEKETAIALFSLSASYGWSAYLYSEVDNTILRNWEGDLFDFWTDSERQFKEMLELLEKFKLKLT